MPDIILKVILPIVGLLIIVFCLGAYFFKYGTRLKDSVQEIKMFGDRVSKFSYTVTGWGEFEQGKNYI